MSDTPAHDIVVIGGSTGAIDALVQLVRQLPKDLPASLFVTIHIPSDAPSYLSGILSKEGPLPAHAPIDVEKIERGNIYVAPPDHHLLIDRGYVKTSRGPRENRHRPAIDPLFRSAARHHGSRVIGVILSGELDDGSLGLMAVKMRGGMAIVQDPNEALAAEMPRQAIRFARPDHVTPVREIARLIAQYSRHAAPARPPKETPMPAEDGTEDALFESEGNDHKPGKPSGYACPECHGVLWEVQDSELRFRCRVGHAYTAQALNEGLAESTEEALWAALRVLQEKVSLLRRLAQYEPQRGAGRYTDQAQGYENHVETIRNILKQNLDDKTASDSS